MPIYSYRCGTCAQTFEVQAKMADPAPSCAPGCASPHCQLTKQLSPVAAIIPGKTTLSAARTHLDKASALIAKAAPQSSDAGVCAKYCDLHK